MKSIQGKLGLFYKKVEQVLRITAMIAPYTRLSTVLNGSIIVCLLNSKTAYFEITNI